MSTSGLGVVSAISTSTTSASMTTGATTVGSHAAVAAGTHAGAAALGSLAAAAAAGALAVGAGVVIAEGLMWCNARMEANYQCACQQWAAFENQVRAESRREAPQIGDYLLPELEFLSLNEYSSPDQDGPSSVPQQTLEEAIKQARRGQASSAPVGDEKAAHERRILAARLRAEIKAGHDILPAEKLAEAGRSLGGSTAEIHAMLDQLEAAWNARQEAATQQARAARRTEQALTLISARLRASEVLIRDLGQDVAHPYQKRLHALETLVQDARDELADQRPERALNLATTAAQDADRLCEEVTRRVHQRWSQQRATINEQIGMLGALWKMMDETEAVTTHDGHPLCDLQTTQALKQRLEAQAQRARSLLEGNSVHLRTDLERLRVAVDTLKEAVFSAVQGGQQHTISTRVQRTLGELGYRSENGALPALKMHGDTARIEVMTSRTGSTGQRDDKVISFDISRDGRVAYDFAGYVGIDCVKAAQQVMDALRAQGLFLVNETALPDLQELPLEDVVHNVLKNPAYQLVARKNKTQAELADELREVLGEMGYQQVQVSSVGGSIELDAFTGTHGYRVVLEPDGDYQIFKDGARTALTHDSKDRVAEASRQVAEVSEEPAIKERKRSHMISRKGQMMARNI